VAIGRVAGAHGLRGQLELVGFSGDLAQLLSADVVWLARRKEDPLPRRFVVAARERSAGGRVYVHLAGIRDRGDAERWKGATVLTERAAIDPLPDDEYYWQELVGCRVESTAGVAIGRVRELWEAGEYDLLVVDDDDGRQHLIPTAREFLVEIDREARKLVVELVDGLLESAPPPAREAAAPAAPPEQDADGRAPPCCGPGGGRGSD